MECLHPAMWHVALESWQWIRQVTAPCSRMTCHCIRPNVRHTGILHLVSISTIALQSTCHSAPSLRNLSKSDHTRQKKITLCRFSRWRISTTLDFRGSLKNLCTAAYRSSIETIALNCLVFEKIAFFCILATDRPICGLWSVHIQTVAWLGCRTSGRANQTWELAAARVPSRRVAAGCSGTWVSSVAEARRRAAEAAARPASRSTRGWRRRRSWAVPHRCWSPSRQSTRRRRRPAPSPSDDRRASMASFRSALCRPVVALRAPSAEVVPPAHTSSTRSSRHRRLRYWLRILTSSWKRRDSRTADDEPYRFDWCITRKVVPFSTVVQSLV